MSKLVIFAEGSGAGCSNGGVGQQEKAGLHRRLVESTEPSKADRWEQSSRQTWIRCWFGIINRLGKMDIIKKTLLTKEIWLQHWSHVDQRESGQLNQVDILLLTEMVMERSWANRLLKEVGWPHPGTRRTQGRETKEKEVRRKEKCILTVSSL